MQPKSDPSDLIEHNKVHVKDVNSSYPLSPSSRPNCVTSCNNDHEEVMERGVLPCPPTNVQSSNLAYDGSCDTWKGQGQTPSQERYKSVQTEGSSVAYSMPGYSTHTSQQACFSSAEFLSQDVPCGSKSAAGYSWNSKQGFRNLQTGSGGPVYSERNDLTAGTAGFSKFKASNSVTANTTDARASALPFYSKPHLSSSSFVGLAADKPLRKDSHLRSHTQPARVSFAYDQMDLIPSLCKQEQGGLSSSSRSIGQRNDPSKMNEEHNLWANCSSSSRSIGQRNDPSKMNEERNLWANCSSSSRSIGQRNDPSKMNEERNLWANCSSSSRSIGQRNDPSKMNEEHNLWANSSSSSSSRSIGQRNDPSKMNEERNLWASCKSSGELVRGPRANRMNNSVLSSEKTTSNCLFRREQFNKSDFQIQYEHAKFFMIKSYSEDDVHKSIKYNVWASTLNGNKKLDAAFRDAETESKEKGTKCPIFLFFSVNASGQFLGLAEMVGPVDFKKTMDFWHQDKWNGFFPVIWHIVKDIPNRHFQSITLENNDNRFVTFSRDTQEIFLPQGLRMLSIFKGYPSGTSILDDFEFYEKKGKSLCTSRSRRPVSKHSDEFSDESTSMKHLESSFRMVGMSARPRSSTYLGTSVINHTSNLSRDNHCNPNRS